MSRDSFLEPLGAGGVSAKVRSPQERDALFDLTVEFFDQRGLIESESPGREEVGAELPLKVPGAPITVRLSKPTSEELAGLLAVAVAVFGGGIPPGSFGVNALHALARRIRRLRTEYGETSIVEGVQEAKPPTCEQITLVLHGHPCRHPDAGCRFMDAKRRVCSIEQTDVSETLAWLIDNEVIRQLNPTEPVEYGLVI